ncbi:hypothetical protein SAMN06264364_13252 [Quadrisphaera granulorum]|uniref:Antitoxin n=1 Tax=Quadrisphaera granulorum TaxID=317664 RepID=A0A315ZSA2_9ACTN|nr:antitoxin [Quadrisphaera granulorum]PWJ48172.1 hypothetical protein BXY45_13252 [Quadrisphaera granulorum]SZE98541.1 hypothetical protein SAMN06264364_13252 [Quadrisphaera granulorum]
MSTLYLRNVPDDVVARLRRMAEQESMSVAAVAVRELAESTRRVDNAAVLAGLPHLDVPMSDILSTVDDARDDR